MVVATSKSNFFPRCAIFNAHGSGFFIPRKLNAAVAFCQMIARLGKEIGSEDSIYYWAWKNGIPVYSPALTDGSIGDMLFFHSYRSPGLVLDLVADIRAMNDEAIKAAPRKTGMIILGGGMLPKAFR